MIQTAPSADVSQMRDDKTLLEGLRVPYRVRKRPLRSIGASVGPMGPMAPNFVWECEFQYDTTAAGRTLRLLYIVDEYT